MLDSNENQPTPVTVPVSDAAEKIPVRGVETVLNVLRQLPVADRPQNQRMNAVA